MDWILRHKIVAVVIVILVAGVAWYMLSGTSSDDSVLTSETETVAPAGAQDLLDSLLALRSVSLDGTIFTNPAFQILRDLTTPITPEPVGRPNPFAPLGFDASVNASSAVGGASTTKSTKLLAPR
ncbi:MAG TPA: hypothetical protein VJG64_02440 [Candidatus Paceibacterota bacterium]